MRTLLLLVAALLSAGSSTSYQPMGFSGGYEDRRVNEDRFWIHVKGNGFTDTGTVVGYFHQRAQEVCVEAGFRSYEVESLGSDASVSYHVTNRTIHQVSKPEVYGTVRCVGGVQQQQRALSSSPEAMQRCDAVTRRLMACRMATPSDAVAGRNYCVYSLGPTAQPRAYGLILCYEQAADCDGLKWCLSH